MKFSLIGILVTAIAAATASAELYTVQFRGNAYRCELDGAAPVQVAVGGDVERFSAVETTANHLYIGLGQSAAGNGIVRCDFDGTHPATLTSLAVAADSIAATDDGIFYLSGLDLHRMDLDGANDSVLTTLGANGLIAYWADSLSVVGSSLYWITDDRRFQSCDLDGGNATQIFQAASTAMMTSACTDGSFIYYALDADDAIYRRDIDGSNETLLVADAAVANGVSSMQISEGTLYWAAANRSIYGLDLAGGPAVEQFNFDAVFGVAINRTIYFDIPTVPEPATLGLLGLLFPLLPKRRVG